MSNHVRQPATIKPRSKQAAKFYGQTMQNNEPENKNEGLDENGRLMKGYRYAKGGIIVKVNPK